MRPCAAAPLLSLAIKGGTQKVGNSTFQFTEQRQQWYLSSGPSRTLSIVAFGLPAEERPYRVYYPRPSLPPRLR